MTCASAKLIALREKARSISHLDKLVPREFVIAAKARGESAVLS
jgi:hypothetical protein